MSRSESFHFASGFEKNSSSRAAAKVVQPSRRKPDHVPGTAPDADSRLGGPEF
jgi:hypothetical protein